MKRYEKYKNSGIRWIGQIPEHWHVGKIKFLCDAIYAGATPSTSNPAYWEGGTIPWIPSGCCHDCNINEAPKYITEEGLQHSSTKLIPANTTVMALTGATCAQLGYLTFESCANQSVVAFVENKPKAHSRYLYYTLFAARQEILSHQSGGAQGGVNQEDCSNIVIPFIALSEQEAIVRFLDDKSSKLDECVRLLELQKADLTDYRKAIISETVTRGLNPNAKLKDSGIQWIGQIPEEWKVVPLKFLLASGMMYGANESADEPNKGWPRYIRITDIAENGSLKDETYMSLSPDKSADYMLQKGDILFARSGATVGKTYMFNENYPACFAGYLIKATCGKDLLPEFLLKYTQSSVYENWKNSIYIQSTIQNIGADKYNQMPIPLAPLSEQQSIVAYLNKKTAKIDEAIKRIDEQIADLRAYRSALISDVVTGKIDVRI